MINNTPQRNHSATTGQPLRTENVRVLVAPLIQAACEKEPGITYRHLVHFVHPVVGGSKRGPGVCAERKRRVRLRVDTPTRVQLRLDPRGRGHGRCKPKRTPNAYGYRQWTRGSGCPPVTTTRGACTAATHTGHRCRHKARHGHAAS